MRLEEKTAVPGQSGTYTDELMQKAPDASYPIGIGPVLSRSATNAKGEASTWLALKVTRQHLNGMGFCHGGVIMTLADEILGVNVYRQCGEKPVPTATLQVQFLNPAREGDLIEACITDISLSRTLAFAQGCMMIGDTKIATTNAIFKIIQPKT